MVLDGHIQSIFATAFSPNGSVNSIPMPSSKKKFMLFPVVTKLPQAPEMTPYAFGTCVL